MRVGQLRTWREYLYGLGGIVYPDMTVCAVLPTRASIVVFSFLSLHSTITIYVLQHTGVHHSTVLCVSVILSYLRSQMFFEIYIDLLDKQMNIPLTSCCTSLLKTCLKNRPAVCLMFHSHPEKLNGGTC
jgi:hypothetical protein